MQTNIKKSNVILGVLVIAFLAVAVSLVFEFAGPSFLTITDDGPGILNVEEHQFGRISHTAGAKTCSQCHEDAIVNVTICTSLCHKTGGLGAAKIPALNWTGVNASGTVRFEHHPGGTQPMITCLATDCHGDDVEINDARYAEAAGNADHDFCGLCHEPSFTTHD